jgi:two-component system, OmpR family, sensor histidine kinase KdpD
MNDRRRDPDTLLEKVTNEEARRHRGRLKVFFGAAPGVGKTFAMLEAARSKRASGADVVIGWVETHGRAETVALLEGLPRLPPHEIEYRGVRLQEFDLDETLARHPQLLLLDELAHTNTPGSRHAKRWQDVLELLDAGIDVYSTLNVQHVESLNDLVQQITGIAVRETVPDHVLDQADDIEFVDLAADDLLRRLAEGKVYVPEQATRAVQQFFRKGNLIALRELALRRTADRVDAQMQDYRRDHAIDLTWPVAERMLVCVRPNPESDRLVRAASRMAARLRAEWIVAHVETPAQPPLSTAERESLVSTMKLAEELGAATTVLSGSSVGAALMEYARERNVSKIVVGKPAHSRWRDRVRGSLLDEIVRESGEVDVYFISGDAKERRAPPPLPSSRRSPPTNYGRAVAAVALCTLICRPMFEHFDRSNIVMVYLLGVAFVATRYGRGPSALAACLSVGLFDFFFVPPYLTFAVSDSQYVVTFTVMLLVSLLISTLAVRVKDQAEAARQRERRTQTLYAMSRDLAGLGTPDEIARVTSRHVGDLFRGKAVILLPDESGALVARSANEVTLDAHELSVAHWALEHGRPAGRGTDTLPGAAGLYVPLRAGERALGVLGVQPSAELLPLSPEQVDVLETFCGQATAALERTRLMHESAQSRVAAERERLRSTLLSSLSHDLRTPLAAITGAATSLRHAPDLPAPVRQELTESICDEAERLNRLSSNLLDMTRLESASLPLRKEWHSLEEIVGSALSHLDRALDGRAVETSLPADLPLVPVDAILIEQVLLNLLENAIKYTEAGAHIDIAARAGAGEVVVEVSDTGPGLPPGEEEHVFEKFYRAGPQRSGFGLGLAICRAILTAHGGRIEAEARSPRGTTFRFHLPVIGTPPPSPTLTESP